MNKIAIFASGSGTNAENIISHFAESKNIQVELILSNRSDAYVIKRAINHNIDYIVFDREQIYSSTMVLDTLIKYEIDYIILAGFLWLVPENIINQFNGKIINIHPALLPQYGGKGMYGDNVHKAVIAAKEKYSGITIHLVNKFFDDGDTLFQAKTEITSEDTAESLAQKIHTLEQKHFPTVIEQFIKKPNSSK